MISNTNGCRKGKKRQNDQRCNMLARVKLEDEGISRHAHVAAASTMTSTVTVPWEESPAASVHNRSLGLSVSTIQPIARGWIYNFPT